MLDLYNEQYDIETLKKNIYALKFIDILKTQKVDAKFAAHYLMNPMYQLCQEDYVSITDVLVLQPHIHYHDLEKELLFNRLNKNNDDILDFEVASNK